MRSRALIAIVATETTVEAGQAAVTDRGELLVSENLVLTIDRRGNAFADFFRRLFAAMHEGKSMPVAWNSISPQIPGQDRADNPETVCIMAAGQIGFGQAPPSRSLFSRFFERT